MTATVLPLRVVRTPEQPLPAETFCSHCARAAAVDPAPRVCATCGLGVVLNVPAAARPSTGDPFVVVDATLKVNALSRHAETLLRTTELDALYDNVSQHLVAAEAGPGAAERLTAALVRAALGEDDGSELYVRPANTFGVRWRAVIAPCGPPNAALLALPGAE